MKKLIERIITALGLAVIAIGVCYACYSYITKNTSSRKAGSPKQKIKVACIGDSITYGSGVRATRKKDSYPAKLGVLLGDAYGITNYGVAGRTLQNEGDYPYRNEKAFAKSRESMPDIVLIMLGTNDTKPYNWNAEAYRKQLMDFVEVYKNLSNSSKVYLMTCCAAYCMGDRTEVAYDINGKTIAGDVYATILEVAEICNVPVIDIYSVTEGHPEYFIDGVHPNAAGNQVIAQAVYDSLIPLR